jgi:GntR family transcriptional regulator
MRISLSKNSEVPLHQQLAEQIVFLITTGELQPNDLLPSVRALAVRLKIHYNTVSKSYQDLVQRGWIKRQPGSRMCVGPTKAHRTPGTDLDELIDESIRRAAELGYSLQQLREKVMQRLSAQPPDHILVIEEEPELRAILCSEMHSRLCKPVAGCTIDELNANPGLALGAQLVAPDYALPSLKPLSPAGSRFFGLTFSEAKEQMASILSLAEPSVIGIASLSKALLKTAKSLLAAAVGRRHSLQIFPVPARGSVRLDGADLAVCDSLIAQRVRCRRKISYRLVSSRCLEDLAARLEKTDKPRA